MCMQVDEEFAAMHADAHSLRSRWLQVKDQILTVAQQRAARDTELNAELQDLDDLDEGI